MEDDSVPENGMQELQQVVIEANEESASSAPFEECEEITDVQEETQYDQLDQETQGVPELEAPPPPVVSNKTPSAPISSTLRVKESSQMMVGLILLIQFLYFFLTDPISLFPDC